MDDRTHNGRRRIASMALLGLLLTLPAGIVQADVVTPTTDCDVTRNSEGAITSNDAGGSKAEASDLRIPADCNGSLTAGSDEQDWYRIELTVGRLISRLEVISEAPLFATGIKMLDQNGELAINPDTTAPYCIDSTPRDSCPQFKSEINATYYLVLTREVGSGTYTLAADGMTAQYDCGTPGDTGTDRTSLAASERPKPITLYSDPDNAKTRKITCEGTFDRGDSYDAYTFFVAKGNVVEVNLQGVDKLGLNNWKLIDPAFGELVPSDCPAVTGTASTTTWGQHFCKPTQISGVYQLEMTAGNAKNQGFVRYPMTVRLSQDDCFDLGAIGDTGDAPDSAATPEERRQIGGACIGTLDGEPATSGGSALDAKDELSLTSDASSLTFTLVPPALNCATLKVTQPGGAITTGSICGAVTSSGVEDDSVLTLSNIAGTAGRWNIDVSLGSLTLGAPADTHKGGAYSLSVAGILGFQDDCATGLDVGTKALDVPARLDPDTGAIVTSRDASCSGDLRATNDTDTYTIPGVAVSDIVTVALGEDDAAQVCLKDAAGTDRGCGNTAAARADAASMAGTWTAIVMGPAPAASTYSLAVSVLSQSDCGNLSADPESPSFVDAGNTAGSATPLSQVASPLDAATGEPALETQTCAASATPGKSGVLRHTTLDNADWYSVDLVNQYTALAVTMVQETLADPRIASDFDLCVIPPGGTQQCSANPPSVPEVVVATPTCPVPQSPSIPTCGGEGTWKIGVIYRAGPLGAYRLAIAGRN